MNIFTLDYDFQTCAKYHVDRHVVKMVLEYAQLLCNAVPNAPYKKTHMQHSCSVWVRESVENWLWLRNLAYALHAEWQYRFEHTYNHKSFDVIQALPMPNLPSIGLTMFPQAMPAECKHADVVTAYRIYYQNHKQHLFKWTKRETPSWIHQFIAIGF